MLKQFFFGKPVTGEPVNYKQEPFTKPSTVPFDMDYEKWKRNIEEFGHTLFIMFKDRNYIK